MKHLFERNSRRLFPGRRATVLICVLVCLSLTIALVTSTTQGALRARRQAHQQQHFAQTQLLLEAGVQRAAARLREDGAYKGETWRLQEETIPGQGNGMVEIEVEPGNTVRVVAQLPADSPQRVQLSYEFSVENP